MGGEQMEKKISIMDCGAEIVISRRNSFLVICIGAREFRTEKKDLIIDAIRDVMNLLPSELDVQPTKESG
jgi:hypothetical protein